MGTTPLGLLYPDPTDAVDVPADIQALAEGVDALFDALGDWAAWTPTLGAVTTPPTLGSGSSASGRWTRVGNTIIGVGLVTFGASGVNAGSGNYQLALPVNAKMINTTLPIGMARITDSSASAVGFLPLCLPTDGDDVAFVRYSATWPTGTLTTVNHSTPWAWAASDSIAWWFIYEAS